MLRRWALAKFSARASKESRWASAISRAVRAVLSTFFAVASTVYLHGCKCLLLYSYHTYIRCQILRRSALPIAPIHPSAWKGYSQKLDFCFTVFSKQFISENVSRSEGLRAFRASAPPLDENPYWLGGTSIVAQLVPASFFESTMQRS